MRVSSLLLVIVLLNSACFAEVIGVPDDFETIQAGIDAAEDGDTVLVQPGTYVENINFGGRAIIVASLILITGNEAYIDSTIIDGDENGSVVRFDSEEDENSLLTGFTITNGSGSGDEDGDNSGGGIHCIGASPRLTHLRVTQNSARYGGGLSLQRSSALISYMFVSNNTSQRNGGGIYATRDSRPEISFTCIYNNNGAWGGGLCSFGGCHTILSNITFNSNRAGMGGYDLALIDRNHTIITNSIIWNDEHSVMVGHGDYWGDTLTVSYTNIENGQDNVNDDYGRLVWRDGNIDTDPLFVDPESGDFHLTADSPCVDTGDPESDHDPDGTRVDMGAFHYHQRDILVEPLMVEFPPTLWDSVSVQLVTISNTGGTDLHLLDMEIPLHPSFIIFDPQSWSPDEPLTIAPDSSYDWACIFSPQREGEGQAMPWTIWGIVSDDPDESVIYVEASGEILSVQNDNVQPFIFSLHPPFPNPFNSTTTITYTLPMQSSVTLQIYNTRGQLVDLLLDRFMPAGRHSVVWDVDGFSAGVYMVKMIDGSRRFNETQKVVLMK